MIETITANYGADLSTYQLCPAVTTLSDLRHIVHQGHWTFVAGASRLLHYLTQSIQSMLSTVYVVIFPLSVLYTVGQKSKPLLHYQ